MRLLLALTPTESLLHGGLAHCRLLSHLGALLPSTKADYIVIRAGSILTRHLCLCQLNLQPAKVGLGNVLDLVLR
jgi:hypothetical protein